MKLNVVLPWILVLGLGAATAAVYVKSTAKDAEIVKLKQQVGELEPLQQEVEELRAKAVAAQDQVLVPRKDKEELIKLRGEVGTLREQAKRLAREIETAKLQAQTAKAETMQAAQLAATNSMMVASMRAAAAETENLNKCINNLRQLDGAKQQWALEHNKTAQAVPTAQDIAPYLNANNSLPACPAGGVYTLNDLSHAPTCSVPAHRLGQ